MSNASHRARPSRPRARTLAQAALAATSLAALVACSKPEPPAAPAAPTPAAQAAATAAPAVAAPAPDAPATPGLGEPIRFVCDDTAHTILVARYRQPDAPSMLITRGDTTAELFSQPVASGSLYANAEINIREHKGEAEVRWGLNATPMRCTPER